MEEKKQQIIKILCTNAEREAIIAYLTTTRRTEVLLSEVKKISGGNEWKKENGTTSTH